MYKYFTNNTFNELSKIDVPQKRESIVDYPFGIFNIELTNKCPMKCVMCPRTNNMTREQGFMDLQLFMKIIDELVENNHDYINNELIWLHHFGESLMHPDFGLFIRYASDKGVNTGLSINPIMLKKSISLELLKSNLTILYISMDGHDDESFYKIRGVKNLYSQSHENLLHFLELKNELSSKIIVILSMIDFFMNKDSIIKMQHYWESVKGIDGVLLKSFSTWDGSADDINVLAGKNNSINIKSETVACTFPWERMSITWDGEAVPCCFDYNKKSVLGNIKKLKLSEIWNGHAMQQLRMQFIYNKITNSLCKNCDKLYLPRHLWEW